jgi:Ca2+-binding RTX toxin-like protein
MGGVVSQDQGQLSFGVSPETWTINKYVFVTDGVGTAVSSNLAHSTLINNGIIHGATSGVLFDAASSTGIITNNARGVIKGITYGIRLDGNGATVTNFGGVIGSSAGIFFDANSRNVVLKNNGGEIFGGGVGVFAVSSFNGGTIANAGVIRSDHYGVEVLTQTGLTTVVKNAAHGSIQGTLSAIITALGTLSLDNHGTVNGRIDCQATSANDTIHNTGKITGEVHLGPGNDTFIGTHGSSGKIFGEVGDDKLTGALHKDFLSGGLGADTFFFKSLKDSAVGSKHDVVTDFSHAQNDTIDVHGIDANTTRGGNQNFDFIGKQGFHHKAGELHFVKHTGFIMVQGDVNGDGKADFEIQLNGLTKIANDDFHL